MLYEVIEKWGGREVSALDVYSTMFKFGLGYIQTYNGNSNDMVANPLGYWRNKGSKSGHYRVMFEDTFPDTLAEMQKADFAIINGITYFGRRNTQQHASKMFALIFDLDGVTDKTLNAFISGASNSDFDIYPMPNYIALSGHGVHLYYLFDEPIPLYPNLKIQLKNLKYALTDRMWNPYTSVLDAKQYQGINQGFRPIGGKTKVEGVTVKAYQMNAPAYTLKQLSEYVPDEYKIDESKLFKESKTTLVKAKELYPIWYEKVVVNKDHKRKKWDISGKVHGDNPYALYDWWKRQIETGASYHHRYFAIMCLAIYGVKCGVPEKQVKKDAYGYIPFMNSIEPEQPFTRSDCDSALECFDDRYCTFPITDLEKISAIQIKRNKRNGRNQGLHLQIARASKGILKMAGEMKTEGRPPKQRNVEEWQATHPNGSKAECIRETGLSKPTVYKYWKA